MSNDYDFEAMLKRSEENNKLERERFKQWFVTQPTEIECERHPGQKRSICEETTRRRGSPDHWKAEYLGCPGCCEDIQSGRLVRYGVPDVLTRCRFENWKPSNGEAQLRDAAREFATQIRKGFLPLLGPVGVGKSHLAVACMRHFEPKPTDEWESERLPMFIKQSSLLRALRATYNDHNAKDPIPRCQKAKLLVLDEMGISGGGKDEFPMIHEILDYRYANKLPTIITSNFGWDELRGQLGERLSDRLREAAWKVLVFSGKSHRAEQRDNYFSITQAHRTEDPYEKKEPKPF